ncbi:MAG: prephenate dehydratase domain-containing protein, partial [Eubacteriales bacterium]
MEDLQTLRQEIDSIDQEITALLERRMDVCTDIGAYKLSQGMPVLDSNREAVVLEAKAGLVENPEKIKDVQAVFETIMGCSRRQQQKLMNKQDTVFSKLREKVTWSGEKGENPAVIFQGQPGAYGEEAAMGFFGDDCDRTNLKSWDGVFRAVKEGFGDYGVIPIENSSTGSINTVYDLLAQFNCYIVGEQVVRVDHCLMVKPGTKVGDIQHVYSHEQGLLQCRNFLGDKKWERHEMANTALSAKFVAECQQNDCAAIASPRAAEIFGLEILQSRINDRMNNYTRFI